MYPTPGFFTDPSPYQFTWSDVVQAKRMLWDDAEPYEWQEAHGEEYRKYDGRRYGFRIENSCGPEVLRRILGGNEISKAEYKGLYYRNALKVKELIKKDFEKAFEKCDFIISPTVPSLPHKIGSKISPKEMYSYDALTIPANFAEICALSVPIEEISKIPVGLQIMAPAFCEEDLFDLAERFESK